MNFMNNLIYIQYKWEKINDQILNDRVQITK